MFRNSCLILLCLLLLASCKSPEARKPVQQTSGTFIKESAERNKELYAQEEAELRAMMLADTSHQYESSENGFWYYYSVRDTVSQIMPAFGDKVTFTYSVNTLDGASVLSESDSGLQHYVIDQTNQDLISGLRDGIKLMKEGETITFLFPSYKAYGYYGIENKLGSNVPVQSTVTLQKIESSSEN